VLNTKWKILLVSLFSLLFVVLNLVFISRDNYLFFAFPLVLIALLIVLFAQEYAYWAVIFFAPLSINVNQLDTGFGIALPTEPLLLALLLFFLVKLFREGKPDAFVLRHPITLSVIFYLSWMFITSLTSEYPLVSFKYLLARLWFIVPLYFMAFPLFKKTKNIFRFFWLSIIPLVLVIIYTTIIHAKYNFSEEVGRWVMSPFYNDHTAYGMILALFLPVLLGLLFWSKSSMRVKFLSLVFSVLVFIAFYLSYSRAAWLSFVLAIFVFVFLKLQIKFRYLFLFSFMVLAFVILNLQFISDRLEKNSTQSSEDFVEHIQSSSNIMTDASNLERINRWNCAIRLFNERKFLGWGPGTYQFVYGPMQRSDERTIISTNSGDAGTAHSEYLGPLAESGIFGLLAILAVFLSLMSTGFKVYRTAQTETLKFLALLSTLALSTYLSHGFLNNFLDTDKASIPFWTFAAIILALDWQNQQAKEKEIL